MSVSLDDIRDALRDRLVTSANGVFPATSNITSPPTQVALPMVSYTPTASVAYLRVQPLLPAEPDHYSVAFDGDVIYRGVFQVDAVVPDNKGEGPGLRLAKLVADRFALGTMIAVGSNRLKILRPPAIAGVIAEKPWLRFPVSVPWFLS